MNSARPAASRSTRFPKPTCRCCNGYGWPGNVREVRNVVERAVILGRGRRLTIELPRRRERIDAGQSGTGRLVDVERDHIRAVLDSTGWRVRGDQGAACVLGIKPTTLEARMVRLGLRRPPRSAPDMS